MKQLITLVLAQIDARRLSDLVGRLRVLDNELDIKIEDIHAAQHHVTVWDRINIFTQSDAEQALQRENLHYRNIRHQHAQIIEQIKELIRAAIFRDDSVAMKVQTGAIMKSVTGLKIEHRWGINTKAHHYNIRGLENLREQVDRIAEIVDGRYGFPRQYLDAEELLELVYEEILKREGFVS